MTDGDPIRNRRQTSASLASARFTLCRLSASGPWLWLARPPAVEAAPTTRGAKGRSPDRDQNTALVLLHGLPGILVTLGEGGPGHG